MKAAVLKDRYKIEIEERPTPRPGPGEVLVKVAVAGICGSDLHAFTHLNFPIGTVMGHEFSGTIEEIPDGEARWKKGQRVAVRPCGVCGECYWCKSGQIAICPTHMHTTLGLERPGGFAEYVIVPTYMLYDLPEEITLAQAAQLEPITVCVHALKMSRLTKGDNILIYGAGPIGLLLFQILRDAGADRILIVEPSTKRRELAARLGCAEIFSPDEFRLEDTTAKMERLGVDIVFDCAGAKSTLQQSFDAVRKGGQIVMLGIQPEPVAFDQFKWIVKGIDVQASMGYFLGEFEVALQLLKEHRIEVDSLVTDIIALDDIEELGFKRLLDPEQSVRVLILPNGAPE